MLLPAAIAAEDSDALALVDREVDVCERPELGVGTGASRRSTRSSAARLSEYCLSA